MPIPIPPQRPKRRRFTASHKAEIIKQYDSLSDPHERGALLRREGLYSSHIAEWRRQQRVNGTLERKRGRPPKDTALRELERLRKDYAKVLDRLAKAEKIIEVQGKVSALLHELADKSKAERSEP